MKAWDFTTAFESIWRITGKARTYYTGFSPPSVDRKEPVSRDCMSCCRALWKERNKRVKADGEKRQEGCYGLPGALGGRGEEVRSAVAGSLLFVLLVTSLLSLTDPLKNCFLVWFWVGFFFFTLPCLPYPQDLRKGKNQSCYLPCVCHVSQPMSHVSTVLAPQFGGCCRTVVSSVSLALSSTVHTVLFVGWELLPG